MKKQQLISALLLICVLSSSLFFASCNRQKNKYTTHSLDYFDTATTITGYESDPKKFDEVSGEILALLGEYHRLFTIYHRFDGMENLCTINELQNGVHRTVTVDRRIIDMLLYAKEMHRVTKGKLNIAMGSVLSIWHKYRTAGLEEPWAAELPPMELLHEAARHTDLNDLIIDQENATVWISDPQMTLDVGAVAKGYAVEMVARSLEERGISGYVINVGGNVRAIGTKPNDEKWLAGIENPNTESEEAYVLYLQLAGESIVTSGSYQRYYTVGNKNYHHIIDSQTLLPAEGYLSVSVVCKNSAEGDALSTALFCMPFEEGLALVEGLPDVEALWILSDESRQSSSGFEKYVTQP
ncbi:MAG: FAD:protein FMN transferase [Clostridia bacterium]|nr:FAD:protein FMN transferase [Clostridia bacterium]